MTQKPSAYIPPTGKCTGSLPVGYIRFCSKGMQDRHITVSFRAEFKYCLNSAESIGIAAGETCSAVNPTFLKNTCRDLAV